MTRSLAVRAAAIYLVFRAISAVFLVLASRDQVPVPGWTDSHVDYFDMTVLWDGSWYRHVAEDGYPTSVPVDGQGNPQQNALAFYPLYPLLAKLLMTVTGLGFPVVASTVALLAGLGAAVLMAQLLADRLPAGVTLGTVAVWASFPASVSLQLAYTESLAMLLLCGFLWAIMRREWLVSAMLSVAIGLTRPIAIPLAVVLAVALWMRWRERPTNPLLSGEALSGGVALVVTGLSGGLWPGIVWATTGSRSAYTDTMSAWRPSLQIVPVRPWIDMSRWLFRDFSDPETYGTVALTALAVGLLVAVLGPWARALGPELRVWCVAYPAYLALVLDPFTSIFRYALPLFPLGAVLIGGGRTTGPSAFWKLRTAAFVVAGVLSQIWWIWFLLVYVPPSDYPP